MNNKHPSPNKGPVSSAVKAFLNDADRFLPNTRDQNPARLVFALDATASREQAWDHACEIQTDMFSAVHEIGSLAVQVCYYRGFRQFHYSQWSTKAKPLQDFMADVNCQGGHTQIEKVLRHALNSQKSQQLKAVVFVGDAVEEHPDTLCDLAGRMGLLNIPLFIFQEGQDNQVSRVFRQLANLSGGIYAPFNLNSREQLKNLLSAVAVFATGGKSAAQALSKTRPDLLPFLKQLR
jgi:hypothetical protein